MKNKDKKILERVHEELTNGYWKTADACSYAPQLFPFVEPDQKVRDALKALGCKDDKDNRFRESRRTIETERDHHHFIREIEHLLEREEMRYRKRFPEEERRDYRDIFMMLVPTIAAQKSNINVNLDVNQLTESIYWECKECSIKETCKEAFSAITEYVSSTLQKLDFTIPSEKEE